MEERKVYFDKQDLFERLHARRNAISIEEFEDLYKCVIGFINNEMQNGTHPAIDLPTLGQIYLTEYAAFINPGRKETDQIRRDNIKKEVALAPKYTRNLLKRAPLHKKFGKIEDIEKKQDEIYYSATQSLS